MSLEMGAAAVAKNLQRSSPSALRILLNANLNGGERERRKGEQSRAEERRGEGGHYEAREAVGVLMRLRDSIQ